MPIGFASSDNRGISSPISTFNIKAIFIKFCIEMFCSPCDIENPNWNKPYPIVISIFNTRGKITAFT
jgi:hypothetical protein